MKRHLMVLNIPVGKQITYTEIDTSLYSYLAKQVMGYVEAIGLENECTMYLNEEGKLDGLPFNRHANSIAHALNRFLPDTDYIVGNVVICGPLNSEGDDTSLTPQHVTEIMNVIFPVKEKAQ
jgi:Domain of unknown function (DUF3846)